MLKRDHPRACGEKFDEEGECKLQVGSPPRMRGKEGKFKADYDKDGITPAHAGKRLYVARQWCILRDHPRACGEKSVEEKDAFDEWGSPPRMRGKGYSAVAQTKA